MPFRECLQNAGGAISDSHPKGHAKRLPFGIYFGTILGLCITGLLLSIYLSVSHLRSHTDMVFQSFCALSKSINCDTVSQSPYSILGPLPIAVWGVAGYCFLLLLIAFTAFPSSAHRRGWCLCLVTAIAFNILSTAFAAISFFWIGSFCILCIATYAVNFFLAYFTWLVRRLFSTDRLGPGFINDLRFLWEIRRVSIALFSTFTAMVLAALLVFPPYWKVDLSAISAPIRTGITGEGHFWIGAEKPELDITEFTDYQCFQCKKMHYYLRKLVARYPDRIRLTHFNFPMDQESNPIVTEPFHVGSGRMALLAIHAAVKGKFIEMNDLLYTKGATGQTIKLKDIAEETGMDLQQLASALTYEPYQRHLSRDIRSGMKLRIVGTPSYQINGSVYEGNIPANILEPFLKDGKS